MKYLVKKWWDYVIKSEVKNGDEVIFQGTERECWEQRQKLLTNPKHRNETFKK